MFLISYRAIAEILPFWVQGVGVPDEVAIKQDVKGLAWEVLGVLDDYLLGQVADHERRSLGVLADLVDLGHGPPFQAHC